MSFFFKYEALDSEGKPHKGELKAANKDEVFMWLRGKEWFPVSIVDRNPDDEEKNRPPKTLSKEEVKELFESQETKQYMKFGDIAFRKPHPNETLVVVCGGKVETVQKVKPDQIVVMALAVGTNAETYAINSDIFERKYEVPKIKTALGEGPEVLYINGIEWKKAIPKPVISIDAFRYKGRTFKFIAPWNKEMLCEDGDWLARTIGTENDIYRIQRDMFTVTYKEGE